MNQREAKTLQHRVQQEAWQASPGQGSQRSRSGERRPVQEWHHPHWPRRAAKFRLKAHTQRQAGRRKAHLKGQAFAARWPRWRSLEACVSSSATETRAYARCGTTESCPSASCVTVQTSPPSRRCIVQWRSLSCTYRFIWVDTHTTPSSSAPAGSSNSAKGA